MGSRKGKPNKLTKDMKEILHLAFQRAGGVDYLVRQADEEPKAFMALLGKMVPAQVAVDISVDLVNLSNAMKEANGRLEPIESRPLIDITPEIPKPLKVKDKE